ncbi:matrixin family metalloprotease [Candidatus Woesearchaeota archaeon]|nr:matrixin family metalloprotease [Candidatus Woesearchaeota archaeon]
MKKRYVILMLLVLVCSVASAAPVDRNSVGVGPSNGHAVVSIPANAVEVTPGVFSLGFTFHGGQLVEGYAIVDYKEGHAKPADTCGNGVCDPGETAKKCAADCGGGEPDPTPDPAASCYGFIGNGAKWRAVEPWVVNPTNARMLNHTMVFDDLVLGVDAWEAAAGLDILGDGSSTYDQLLPDTESPDGLNEVIFADVASENAIAITIVWGVFRGAPMSRQLVEWDQVYDDVDFDWSVAGDADRMDFLNIATHELGHSVGMGDVYDDVCSEQTMYGYASYGETKKYTLESADITGVQELYS